MAKEMVLAVYRISGEGRFSQDFALRDQLRRAAVSVMSNIAEGFERGSKVEFARFLRIANGSCGEVRSQLYVARDLDYLRQEEFVSVKAEAENLSKVLAGFIRYLSRANAKSDGVKVRKFKSLQVLKLGVMPEIN